MRDGRRKRLGLVEGSEGTVGDTYLDRILTDTEAANTRNVVKADPNVNFDAGNYNYVTDLYDYFSSGGAEEDTTPVVTPPSDGGGGGGDGGTSVGNPGTGGTTPGNTDFEDYLLDEGIGIQDKPGDPVVAPGMMGGVFVPPLPPTFGNLIREGQISVIMALIKPEVKLFPYLNVIKHGKESDEVLGGYTQSDWVKVRDNESFPQESRTLAGVIINARKSPDTLTSRIADCLGVELTKRQLSKQLRPGNKATPQFVRITEILHPLYELLSEAAIDAIRSNSASDSTLKQ